MSTSPSLSSSSTTTTATTPPEFLRTIQFSFVDIHGRRIHLRGVNLSGAAKAPLSQPSHILKDFWETAEAGGETFTGQPLNLEDGSADEHLARLRAWGFNLLRFPVTWEALEHAGPKKYDYGFMDYIIRVLLKCKEYGFRVFMDPHQDTWSRFSGGSGAPFWTLPACGINPYNLSATQSALIHSEWPLPHNPDPPSFPAMIWGTNYGRLLSQTLFTIFFAGRTFAPNCIIDDMNIQDYLQSHFIAAFGELADRIRRADEEDGAGLRDVCIIGWDSLNEPAEGLVEWEDLNMNPTKQGTTLKKGTHPTPAQSLSLGMGKAQTVECWDFGAFGPKRDGSVTIDPKGRKVWADPDLTGAEGGETPDGIHPRWGWKRDVSKWKLGKCIWAQHGVWDIESGFVLRPDYFKYDPKTGIEVEFITDFWLPHFKAYGERIRRAHPNAILFIQPPVFALPPSVSEDILRGRCAYTGHYYDGLTLITKHWNWFNADSLGVLRGKYKSPLQAVKFGESAIRKSLMEQIACLMEDAKIITAPPCDSLLKPPSLSRTAPANEYPTIIGEIGTPFDMDKKRSYYSARGDFSSQEKALDASLNACDGYNNVGYTIWTYVPQGHSHQWGDAWNGEDLSLWSPDDLRDTYLHKIGDTEDEEFVSRLRRRRGSERVKLGRNDSQAGLLAKASGVEQGLGSKNVSTLSVTTLPALEDAIGEQYNGLNYNTSDFPRSLPPSVGASTSTLPLSQEPSPKPQPRVPPASSSTSSLTLRRETDPDDDPYDFLTDGARAVRAFCRPRAMKTFGKILDTKFEISKAEFKWTIKTLVPPSSDPSARVTVDGDETEGMATEIYLPLVHFASSKLLERSKARWDPSGLSSVLETSRVYAPKWKKEGVHTNGGMNFVTGHSDDSDRESVRRRVLEGIEEREDLLDVEVKVSGGTWKIRGQTLFWWYPTSPASPGEETEYTIEVKRRGGAIKIKKGGWVEPKSWQRPQQRRDGAAEKTCDRCCCAGCVIM